MIAKGGRGGCLACSGEGSIVWARGQSPFTSYVFCQWDNLETAKIAPIWEQYVHEDWEVFPGRNFAL